MIYVQIILPKLFVWNPDAGHISLGQFTLTDKTFGREGNEAAKVHIKGTQVHRELPYLLGRQRLTSSLQ